MKSKNIVLATNANCDTNTANRIKTVPEPGDQRRVSDGKIKNDGTYPEEVAD